MAKSPPGNDPAKDLVQRAYAVETEGEQRQLYKEWADSYDAAMVDGLQYVSPLKCAALLAEHVADRNATILDVGCGTGLAGHELHQLGFRTMDGLDLSEAMLQVARQRGIYRDLVTADLLKPLDIADATYGAAICTGTFTHAHVGAACLDELARVLAPGAVFSFTVHRDVHEELGFANKLAELTAAGTLGLVSHRLDTYYANSEEPEGHFYAYRRM